MLRAIAVPMRPKGAPSIETGCDAVSPRNATQRNRNAEQLAPWAHWRSELIALRLGARLRELTPFALAFLLRHRHAQAHVLCLDNRLVCQGARHWLAPPACCYAMLPSY